MNNQWLIATIIALTLLLCTSNLNANETHWRQYYSDQSLKIHYRDNGTHLEVKAHMTTTGNSMGFLNAFLDIEWATYWVANAKEIKTIKSSEKNELNLFHTVHTVFNSPWPMKDRQAVTDSITIISPDKSEVSISISDSANRNSLNDNLVTITDIKGKWISKNLNTDTVEIIYQGTANPGGNLPKWLIKKVTLKRTKTSFEKLAKLLQRFNLINPE